MNYHCIDDLFEMIERKRASFAASVSNLTEAQENFRPAPDRWTIAENSEHVSIVNTGFMKLAHRLLKQAEADPKPPSADLEPLLQTLARVDLTEKWRAPETVAPKGGVSVAESIVKNERAINDIFTLKSRLEAVDLSGPTWEHPFLGQINLYQTLVVLGVHQERHRLQIEAIKSSAGFPA